MKHSLHFAGSLLLATLFAGCGSTTYVTLKPLELQKNSYTKASKASALTFALSEANFSIKSSLSRDLTYALTTRLEHNAGRINCHFKSEFNKILSSKGFSISSTFKNYEEMTYTQKRDTSALFIPEIEIRISEQSISNYYKGIKTGSSGIVTSDVKLNIMMIEPLTGEKIWIKSMDPQHLSVSIKYDSIQKRRSSLNAQASIPVSLEPLMHKIDELFVQIDSSVLQTAYQDIVQAEIEAMKNDIDELKHLKRY